MVVLVAFYGKSYDDGIQKRRIVDSDVVVAEVVAYIELELVRSGNHRSIIKQRLLRATINIRGGIRNLLAPLFYLE